MARLEIQLDNGYLNISKDFPISLNYSIDDIKEIENKNSSFSKSIILPGNKNNNKLLGSLFDINTDFTFFNPNFKTNAKLLVDDIIILDGFLQLKSINKLEDTDLEGNQIEYNVTLSDKLVDIMSDIGDKLLSDIDLSTFNHIYSKENIENSWSHISQDVYTYPIMYNGTSLYETKDFKPAIFHSYYIKKILTDLGYSVSGSLFNNKTYSKEILPFINELVTLPLSEYNRRLFKASITSNLEIYNNILFNGDTWTTHTVQKPDTGTFPLLNYNDDTNAPNFDNDNHYDTSLNKWTIDRNGSYNISGKLVVKKTFTTLQNISSVTDDGGSPVFHTLINNKIVGQPIVYLKNVGSYTNGYYSFVNLTSTSFKITSLTYIGDATGEFGIKSWWSTFNNSYNTNNSLGAGGAKFRNKITLLKNGVDIDWYIDDVSPISTGNYLIPDLDISNNFTYTITSVVNINSVNLQLLIGDEITFSNRFYQSNNVNLRCVNSFGFSGSPVYGPDVPYTIKDEILITDGTNISSINNQCNSSDITDGDMINLNNYIPQKIKQKDLIIDIIKRYNVYIRTNSFDKRKLILDTREDYYNAGGILDWTNKKDYNKKDKIILLSQLQSKEVTFSYTKDKDFQNQKYIDEHSGDRIYGDKKISFDSEFIKGDKKITTPFSPTPLIPNETGNPVMIIPSIHSKSPKIQPRTLYFAGLINTIDNRTWTFKWINGNVITNTTYNQYPYSGHYDNPFTPKLDINYGQIDYPYYSGRETITTNTLYNLYWKNYMEEISEGRMITSYFDLTPVDINFIKDNLNTKIFVKDTYYYINKIEYNPVDNSTSKVELLKINKGVPFLGQSITSENPILNPFENTIRSIVKNPPPVDTLPNSSSSSRTNISGVDNTIGFKSQSTDIIGNNNRIGNNVINSGVVGGDNNKIQSGVNNSWIVGVNNKTITQDNEIWLGQLHYINGRLVNEFNIIDGGQDIVYELYPLSPINIIDGGQDTIRAYNLTNTINIINGGQDRV